MTQSQFLATDDEFDDDDLPDAVREAEAAVAALAANFTEWMRDDLNTAFHALTKAKETLPENAEAVREIYEICHNIKGQGGSFGYQLITLVGQSLCTFIHDRGPTSERKLKVVEAHLTAIKFIVDREIQGDGGEVGQQLQAKLQTLIDQSG